MYTLQQASPGPHSVLSQPALQQCALARLEGQELSRKRYTRVGHSFHPLPIIIYFSSSVFCYGNFSWVARLKVRVSVILRKNWLQADHLKSPLPVGFCLSRLLLRTLNASGWVMVSFYFTWNCITFPLSGLSKASCCFSLRCLKGIFLLFTFPSSSQPYCIIYICLDCAFSLTVIVRAWVCHQVSLLRFRTWWGEQCPPVCPNFGCLRRPLSTGWWAAGLTAMKDKVPAVTTKGRG